jgi:hypothetical protein
MKRTLFAALWLAGTLLADSKNQVFSDFTTPLPLKPGDTLVVGIVGGWERWDHPGKIVGRVAAGVREKKLPGVYVETVENHKLYLAEELIRRAFPVPAQARLVLYGQSLGASATVRLTRRLHELGYPVLFAGIVDLIGKNDPLPPNVRTAINFYQRDSWFINGARKITAENPAVTRILGNYRFFYSDDKPVNWPPEETTLRKVWLKGHLKMEYDPEVIALLRAHVLTAIPQWTGESSAPPVLLSSKPPATSRPPR